MINTQFREYSYYKYSTSDSDSYGQPIASDTPVGTVKLAVNVVNQQIQDSILYKDASYIALTWDKDIDDTYTIQYNDEVLKVLYVSTPNKLKMRQVYLQKQK